MTLLPKGVKVHVALGITDMRKGLDGLAMLVQGTLQQDPFSGHLFAFRGRRADLIKIVAEVRVAKLHQPPAIARLCTWVHADRASVQAVNRQHLYSVDRRRRHAELSLAWVGYEDEVSESEAVDGTTRADAGDDDLDVRGGRSGRS